MEMINIGLGNFVSTDKVIAIVNPESAPIKRMISESKDKGTAIDATYGRRTRSVIVMINGQIILSSVQPSTIIDKPNKKSSK